jgi:uncharacterized protein YprB with RNaseH-like and TPR domain
MRVAFFDIESSHLKADFGVMLCACVKPLDEDVITLDGRRGSNDKELCLRLKEELEKYDILVSYYGLGFDVLFLNSRLLHYGLEPLKMKYHIDMYGVVRKFAALHSRRLESVSKFLGIKGKGSIEPELWVKAAYDGDKDALAKIKQHCKEDVEVLESLYEHPHIKQFLSRSIQMK